MDERVICAKCWFKSGNPWFRLSPFACFFSLLFNYSEGLRFISISQHVDQAIPCLLTCRGELHGLCKSRTSSTSPLRILKTCSWHCLGSCGSTAFGRSSWRRRASSRHLHQPCISSSVSARRRRVRSFDCCSHHEEYVSNRNRVRCISEIRPD